MLKLENYWFIYILQTRDLYNSKGQSERYEIATYEILTLPRHIHSLQVSIIEQYQSTTDTNEKERKNVCVLRKNKTITTKKGHKFAANT